MNGIKMKGEKKKVPLFRHFDRQERCNCVSRGKDHRQLLNHIKQIRRLKQCLWRTEC